MRLSLLLTAVLGTFALPVTVYAEDAKPAEPTTTAAPAAEAKPAAPAAEENLPYLCLQCRTLQSIRIPWPDANT